MHSLRLIVFSNCILTRLIEHDENGFIPKMGWGLILALGGSFLAIWSCILTVILWKVWSHYRKLIGDTKEKDLKRILERILVAQSENRKYISELSREIERLDEVGKNHYQVLKVVRYNPFDETGGNQSFSMSLIDGNRNGIILTSLHTRERSRFYVKCIKDGKPDRDLSKEEKKVLEI